jgi:hypothetical protein
MQKLIKSAGASVCGDFVVIGNDQRHQYAEQRAEPWTKSSSKTSSAIQNS